MKRFLILAGVPVVLAAAVILTVVPDAQSGVYSTTYYNIYYYNISQWRRAKSLAPYLNRAFWAAKTTIGYDARRGKMKIHFKYAPGGAAGWMVGGRQDIYLSVPHFKSYDKWGSVVAEQSAKVLFYNFTKAHLWNGFVSNERNFLTESLALYAGNYVYNWYQYKPLTAFNVIRSQLRYYASKTGSTMSWTESGRQYLFGKGNFANQATWQLKAIGWFLAGGRLTGSSPKVRLLLQNMSVNGSYLRSPNGGIAWSYFERVFEFTYGKYANSDWQFTGSYGGAYKNTTYLYGIFWYYFYR